MRLGHKREERDTEGSGWTGPCRSRNQTGIDRAAAVPSDTFSQKTETFYAVPLLWTEAAGDAEASLARSQGALSL